MSNKSVVVLLIVALSLAGAVLLFERQISQEARPSADEYKVFKAYSSDQVDFVSLVNGDLSVQLKRVAEGWQQTSPVVAAADEQGVGKLLEQLGELEEVAAPIKARPGETINMADYGLAEPSQKIIVSYGGVEEAGLSLGRRTEKQDQLYARLGKENRVMIIDAGVSRLLEEIAADKNLYRSRRIFQAKHINKALEIQVLTAENQKEKPIALQKNSQSGLWVLRSPVEDRADQEKVQELLEACAGLQAAEFVELPRDQTELARALKIYGLTGEEKTDIIAVAAEGMQTVLLNIGRTDEQKNFRYGLVEKGAVLAASQEVVKIPADFAKVLPRSAESLRDRKFLRFEDQKVNEVRLSGAEGVAVLWRDSTKGQWVLRATEAEGDRPADQKILGYFLRKIKGLRASGFAGIAEADMGFEIPYLSVQIKTDQRGRDEILQIGALTNDGGNRYARLSSDKTVRLVRAEAANDLLHDKLYFYERKLAQVGRRDIKKCEMAASGQAERQAIQKEGQWWLTKPSKVRADNNLVGNAIGVFDPLRAERIVAEKVADGAGALADYGLAEPAYRLTVIKEIEADGGQTESEPPVEPGAKYEKEEYVLLVGKAVGAEAEQYYGRLEGQELVFTIPKESVEKISADWRSKKVWPLASRQTKQLNKVEISKGAETLTLEKPRENWQVITPKKFWPNQQAVNKLLWALVELEAAEFGEDGDDKQYGLTKPTMVVKTFLSETQTSEQKEFRFIVGQLIEGKGYTVKTDGEDVVRLVAADELKLLGQNYLSLREKQVLNFETKEVQAIEIRQGDRKKYRAQRAGAGWKLTVPRGAALELAKLQSILAVLSNLRASEFVADTPAEAKKYGLEKPYLTVTVEMDQKTSHDLLVGDEIKQADKEKTRPRYAVLGGDSTIFVISGENVEVLATGIMFKDD